MNEEKKQIQNKRKISMHSAISELINRNKIKYRYMIHKIKWEQIEKNIK